MDKHVSHGVPVLLTSLSLAALACALIPTGLSGSVVRPTSQPTAGVVATAVTSAGHRNATIQSVQGTVQVRMAATADFAPAMAGMTLAAGDELRTDADGRAVLVLDDGTVIFVAEYSFVALTELSGPAQTPITRLYMNLGQVFSIRDAKLPQGATYEVTTPLGAATIRGSAMSVSFLPEAGSQVTCLFGECGAQAGEKKASLGGGQQVEMTQAGLGELAPMDPESIQEWTDVYNLVEQSGVSVQENPLDTGCTCDGTVLVCPEGAYEDSSACGGSGQPGGDFPDLEGGQSAEAGTGVQTGGQGTQSATSFWSDGDEINGWYWLRGGSYQSSAQWEFTPLPAGTGDITLAVEVLATSTVDGPPGYDAEFYLSYGVPGLFFDSLPVVIPNAHDPADGTGYICRGQVTIPRTYFQGAQTLWLMARRDDERGQLQPFSNHVAFRAGSITLVTAGGGVVGQQEDER